MSCNLQVPIGGELQMDLKPTLRLYRKQLDLLGLYLLPSLEYLYKPAPVKMSLVLQSQVLALSASYSSRQYGSLVPPSCPLGIPVSLS